MSRPHCSAHRRPPTGPSRPPAGASQQPSGVRRGCLPGRRRGLVHLASVVALLALAAAAAPAGAQDLIHGDVQPLASTTIQVVIDTAQPLRQLSDSGSGPYYRLSGWAADVRATTPPGVRQIVAYLDGPSGRGHLLGWARYGLPRPDVGSALNDPAATPCGFELVWHAADLPLQTEPVRQTTLYLYLDTGQGWVLARLPLAISIWADSGE